MNLTTVQLQAAEKGPVTVESEGKEYVLLSKQIYERVKQMVGYSDCDLSHDELRGLLAHSVRASGWHEPGMEDYDRYDELKS